MRNLLLYLAPLILLNGCLKKMEDITTDTRDQVIKSTAAIEETHKGTTLKTALDSFFTFKDPSMRAAAGESVILLADPDRLFLYLGAARPFHYYMLTRFTPNVSWVGTEAGSDDPENSNHDLNIDSIRPSTVNALISACHKGLTFLKGLYIDKNPDLDQIKTKGTRALQFCPGIYGARRLPALYEKDDHDISKRAWPLTPAQEERLKADRIKGEKLMREVVAFTPFDDDKDFRDMVNRQIEVKVLNRFEHADNDADR